MSDEVAKILVALAIGLPPGLLLGYVAHRLAMRLAMWAIGALIRCCR